MQSEDAAEKRTMVLVELDSVEGAHRVAENLEGQDIYSDCCTLHIEPSTVASLAGSIIANDEHTFDYTLESTTTAGAGASSAAESAPFSGSGFAAAPRFPTLYQPNASYGQPRGTRFPSYGIRMPAPRFPPTGAYARPPPPGAAAAPDDGSTPYGMRGPIMMQMRMPEAAGVAPYANPCVMLKGLRAAASGAQGANAERTLNCDHVFNLVCLYGDVVRIKVLISAEGTAMVQMADSYGEKLHSLTRMQ